MWFLETGVGRPVAALIFGAAVLLLWEWYCARSNPTPNVPVWLGFLFIVPLAFFWGGAFGVGSLFAWEFVSTEGLVASVFPWLAGLASMWLFAIALSVTQKRIQDIYVPRRVKVTGGGPVSGNVYAYSMDIDQKTVEEGVTDRKQALETARTRLAEYRDFYEDLDQSLVDGHFGFYRTKSYFLEIGIVSKDSGSFVWYEGEEERQFLGWRWRAHCRYEMREASPDLVLECVEKFFGLSMDEFLAFFKRNGARRDSGRSLSV